MKANNPVFLSLLLLIIAATGYLWLSEPIHINHNYSNSIGEQRLNLADSKPQSAVLAFVPNTAKPKIEPAITTPWQSNQIVADTAATSFSIDDQHDTEHETAKRRQLISNYIDYAKQKQQKLEQLIAQSRAAGIEKNKLIERLNKIEAIKEGIKMAERDLAN